MSGKEYIDFRAANYALQYSAVMRMAKMYANRDLVEEKKLSYSVPSINIDFWAIWCAPCKEGIKNIGPLKNELSNNNNIVFLYITNNTSPEQDYESAMPDIKGEHYKATGDEWNYLVSKFKIYGIPHYTLVDKAGNVVDNGLHVSSNEKLKEILLKCADVK